MFVEATLKSGLTKTKPLVPAVAQNGNDPPATLHALSIASSQINAEVLSNQENINIQPFFNETSVLILLFCNLFSAFITYNNRQSKRDGSLHSGRLLCTRKSPYLYPIRLFELGRPNYDPKRVTWTSASEGSRPFY
jgi:hypothetical protein